MEFRKILNGELIAPPKQYPVTIDDMTIYFCYNYNQLTESQIEQLKKDGWKEFVYNYEADNNELVETDTQIIQNVQKMPEPTDEQKFDSQVCIDRLWVKFITSLAVFSSVSAPLIQVLQGKKPDNNGSYYSYFWCIKIYLAQVRNSNLISQSDYERVLSVFMEQNINLENY